MLPVKIDLSFRKQATLYPRGIAPQRYDLSAKEWQAELAQQSKDAKEFLRCWPNEILWFEEQQAYDHLRLMGLASEWFAAPAFDWVARLREAVTRGTVIVVIEDIKPWRSGVGAAQESPPALAGRERYSTPLDNTQPFAYQPDSPPADNALQLAGSEGTPGNNQAQNKQFRAVVRILGLSPDQARLLHEEISGEGLGYHEIMERAQDMFGDSE